MGLKIKITGVCVRYPALAWMDLVTLGGFGSALWFKSFYRVWTKYCSMYGYSNT